MKTTLTDLHNYLFEQLDRLSNEDLDKEQLDLEIVRAKALCDVSAQILANASLILRAAVAADNFLKDESSLPKILGGDADE